MNISQRIYLCLLGITLPFFSQAQKSVKYAVAISANAEWRALKKIWPNEKWKGGTPYGQYFFKNISVNAENAIFLFTFFLKSKATETLALNQKANYY